MSHLHVDGLVGALGRKRFVYEGENGAVSEDGLHSKGVLGSPESGDLLLLGDDVTHEDSQEGIGSIFGRPVGERVRIEVGKEGQLHEIEEHWTEGRGPYGMDFTRFLVVVSHQPECLEPEGWGVKTIEEGELICEGERARPLPQVLYGHPYRQFFVF